MTRKGMVGRVLVGATVLLAGAPAAQAAECANAAAAEVLGAETQKQACLTDLTTAGTLDAWVDRGVAPPPSQFVPDARPPGSDVANARDPARVARALLALRGA